MLRFKQQNRRDHVVSLLPPISVIKNKAPSVQERIYSDTPPPMTYTGSFPAKVLRHLDKSTFYSTPTKGETLLAKKTMHDEEQKTAGKKEVIKTSCSKDNDSLTDHNKKNKKTISKIKKNRIERKVDGMKEDERRCSSAPGFRKDEQEEQLKTGNLTAPVTPRFNAAPSETSKSTGKTLRVHTPRSPTPRGYSSPDFEQDTEVVLELRGDRIGTTNPSKGVDSTSNSRVATPCRFDWQAAGIPEQDTSAGPTKPKIRSAIREVPCAQKRTEKIPPKYDIRAVGFSLPFHDKSESSAMTKEKKNEMFKNSKVTIKDKTIKIPRHEAEDPTPSSLPTVTEAEGTNGEDEKEESICDTKVDSNTLQSLQNENTTNDSSENLDNGVKFSERLEDSLIEKPVNENEKKNENGNEQNKPKTENETDLTKEVKKKKSSIDKKGGCRNSKTKGRSKK